MEKKEKNEFIILDNQNNSQIFDEGKPNNENQYNSFQNKLENISYKSYSKEETKAVNSDSFDMMSISSINEDLNKSSNTIAEFLKKNIFCPECKSYIIINLTNNYNYINIECECCLIYNITLDKFRQNYIDFELFENVNICNKHNKEYTKYCIDCRENLCDECQSELDKEKIEEGRKIKFNGHGTHTLKGADMAFFDENKNKINEFISILQKNKNLEILNFIEELVNIFEKNPCYYKSIAIKNIVSFIDKYPNFPKDYFSKTVKLEEKKFIKIHKLEELDEKINSEELVHTIDINNKNSEIKKEIDFFKDKNFPNLKNFYWNGLSISTLEPLINKELSNLIMLLLERNNLNDACIDIFDNLVLPNIECISLYENKITSIRIFYVMKKFKNLTKLYLGHNKFSADEINKFNKENKNDQIIEFPPKLILLGLSGNFNKETNCFIKKLNFENIQVLYLYDNELNSLKILENIYFKNLKKIWLNGNNLKDISEIDYLKGKENIELINLIRNKLNDDNVKKFINLKKNFPKLTKLNLSRCGISKNISNFIQDEINKNLGNKNKFEIINI